MTAATAATAAAATPFCHFHPEKSGVGSRAALTPGL